jgi:hypothetical protein
MVGAEGFEPHLGPSTKTRTSCDLGAKREKVWVYAPSIPSLPSLKSTQETRFPGIFVSFVSMKNERESVEKWVRIEVDRTKRTALKCRAIHSKF